MRYRLTCISCAAGIIIDSANDDIENWLTEHERMFHHPCGAVVEIGTGIFRCPIKDATHSTHGGYFMGVAGTVFWKGGEYNATQDNPSNGSSDR